jgi:hypothetical protein
MEGYLPDKFLHPATVSQPDGNQSRPVADTHHSEHDSNQLTKFPTNDINSIVTRNKLTAAPSECLPEYSVHTSGQGFPGGNQIRLGKVGPEME